MQCPPRSGSRKEREKAEGFGRSGGNHLIRVDAEMVAENGKFIDQADIDQTKRIFEELYGFGGSRI